MKVRVQIYSDHGEVLHDAALDVSVAREAMAPLDFPSKNAGEAAAFCTPTNQRTQTEAFRKQLASALTSEFLTFFRSHDTEMGYRRH